jgi:hypothetical protein
MLKVLAKPWELLKALFRLALPMFAGSASSPASGGSLGTWMARLGLVGLILVALGLVNRSETLGLSGWIDYGRVSKFWLPLFAACIYAMVWTGWWIHRLINLEVAPVTSEFPDIDRAWEQALEALGQAEIHVEETPLFLVLGLTAEGEAPLFHAAKIKAQVKQVPRDPSEPLHVTANRDAIWVTCPGASVLGQQDTSFDGEGVTENILSTLAEKTADPFKTVGVAGGETLRIEDFMASLKNVHAGQQSPLKRRKLTDTERYVSRLRYFCRLIARDRQGFCPVNGILVVLPITATNPQSSLAELAAACKADLATAFEVFRMRCPVLVMFSGLEKLEGFSELVERLPSGSAAKRMGQRFPLDPDLDIGEVPARIETSVSWIANALFPSMVYSLFRVESPGGEEVSDVVRANAQLYRFLSDLRDRQQRLARLVKDSIPAVPGEPIFFGGCYVAGTGLDAASQQAFASGVLARLIQDQDNVTWTAEALGEDAGFLRFARGLKVVLIGVIALGLLAITALIVWVAFLRPRDVPAN